MGSVTSKHQIPSSSSSVPLSTTTSIQLPSFRRDGDRRVVSSSSSITNRHRQVQPLDKSTCDKLQQKLQQKQIQKQQIKKIISELKKASCDQQLLNIAIKKLFDKFMENKDLEKALSTLEFYKYTDKDAISRLLKAYIDMEQYRNYFYLLYKMKEFNALNGSSDVDAELDVFLSSNPDHIKILIDNKFYFDKYFLMKSIYHYAKKTHNNQWRNYIDQICGDNIQFDNKMFETSLSSSIYTELEEYLFNIFMEKVKLNKFWDYDSSIDTILKICRKLPMNKQSQVYFVLIERAIKDKKYNIIPLVMKELEGRPIDDDIHAFIDVIEKKIEQLIRTQKFTDARFLLQKVVIPQSSPQKLPMLESKILQLEQKLITTSSKIPTVEITTDDLAYVANKWALNSRFSALTQSEVDQRYQQIKKDTRHITLLDILQLWYKPRDRYYFFHSGSAKSIESLVNQLTRPTGQRRDLRGDGVLDKGFYVTPDLYMSFLYGLKQSKEVGSVFVLSISKKDASKFIYKSDFLFGDRNSYIYEDVKSSRLNKYDLPKTLGLKEVAINTDPLLSSIRLDMVLLFFNRQGRDLKINHFDRSSGKRTTFNVRHLQPILNLLFSDGGSQDGNTTAMAARSTLQSGGGGGGGAQSDTMSSSTRHIVPQSKGVSQSKTMMLDSLRLLHSNHTSDLYLKNKQFDKILSQDNLKEKYKKYISQVLKSSYRSHRDSSYHLPTIMEDVDRVITAEKGQKIEVPLILRVNEDGMISKTTIQKEQQIKGGGAAMVTSSSGSQQSDKRYIFAFDFDWTLTDEHSGGNLEVGKEYITDPHKGQLLISLQELAKFGPLYIITRGLKQSVIDYLTVAFNGKFPIPSTNIYGAETESQMLENDSVWWSQKKVEFLKKIQAKHRIPDKDRIVFMDDTEDYVNAAKRNGFTTYLIRSEEDDKPPIRVDHTLVIIQQILKRLKSGHSLSIIEQERDAATSKYLVYFQELGLFLEYMKTKDFSDLIKNIIELFPDHINVRILFNHFIPPRYGKTMVRCLIYNAGRRALQAGKHRQIYFEESLLRRKKTNPLALVSTSIVTPRPILVIPPYSKDKDYVDINAFVRHATIPEITAFFSFSSDVISFAMSELPASTLQSNRPIDTRQIVKYRQENNLAQKGVFVSFHSGTVGWLHLRIDATPAYYIDNWEEYLENPLYRKVLKKLEGYKLDTVNVKIFTAQYERGSKYHCTLNQTFTNVPTYTPLKSILYDYFNIPLTEDEKQAQQLIKILESTHILFLSTIFFVRAIIDVRNIELQVSKSDVYKPVSLASVFSGTETLEDWNNKKERRMLTNNSTVGIVILG
jgi:hypothetical protein